MFWLFNTLGHLLLGGAFVLFGIRNIKNIPRLTGVLEQKKIPQPKNAATFGVGLQIVGGALTALAPFGPFGVLGGLAMIVFLVLATVLFHPYWDYSGEEQIPHINATIMNTSLVGAFLMVIALGSAG